MTTQKVKWTELRPSSHEDRLQLTIKATLALIFFGGVFLLTGCRTTGANTGLIEKPATVIGSQSISAEITVEKKSSLFKLKSEINIIEDRAVRLDLMTTMDLPLASIVLTENKIEYLLYRDKKFYSGKPGPHALDPVFPLAIDARRLINLLKEEKNPEDLCESDEAGLTDCHGTVGATAYSIGWRKRKDSGPLAGRASRIILELPQKQVALKFFLTDWRKDVPNAERLLALAAPEGFRQLAVPER